MKADVEKHLDLAPDTEDFGRTLVKGLRSSPKSIPCKYLYDTEGSRLFERITELPEYYPTRTEISILEANAGEMARLLGPRCLLIEYGSGSSVKTEIVLHELREPAAYVPIDISRRALLESAARVKEAHPDLEVLPVVADYTAEVEVPVGRVTPLRRAFFFPGSTIGNFERADVVEFLEHVADIVGPGGALLIGVDLRKDRETLERAYDDAAGVTAAFNLNLLTRANRELGADFRPELFEHRAVWNEEDGRVEMHLVSTRAQTVRIGGESFSFEKGETIWTESSHKYDPEEFGRLAASAGFRRERVWMDERRLFSVQFYSLSG